MICFLCVSSTYIYGTLLTANGNLAYLNIVASVGVVFNIALNIILIPKHQALGSAFASLITQFLTGICQIILCIYVFRLSLNNTFFRLLLFLAGLIICAYYLNFKDYSLYYSFLLYSMFSLIWLFVTRVLVVTDFQLLLKNKFK